MKFVVLGEDFGMEATSLVAEESVFFSFYIVSFFIIIVADIRNVYNEVDSRLIVKEVGMFFIFICCVFWEL